MADTETKLNAEEQAAVEKARKDLEEAKSRIGQPLNDLREPLWLLTPEGQKVLVAALGRDERGNIREIQVGTVSAVIPKAFTLTLTHHHKFDFQPGIRELPAALLDHPWVRAHGVSAYKAAQSKPPEVLLGSQTMADPVKVGDKMMPLGPFIVAAHTASGRSVTEWNALTDAERDAAIQAEIAKVAVAAAPVRADSAPSGGFKKK